MLSSSQSIVSNDYPYTREEINQHSGSIRLTDTDSDTNLDMFCYSKCTGSDDDIVKRTRGVVFNDNNLVFSGFNYVEDINVNNKEQLETLSKSLATKNYKVFNSYEGTLVRVFYFGDKWYVTTHRKLDAFKSKWAGKNSFGDCFKNSINENGNYDMFFDTLDKRFGYMFLLVNNNDNRIVCIPGDITLLHVGTFDENKKLHFDIDIGIERPKELTFDNFESITDYVENISIENYQGVIIFDGNLQHKILNSSYVELFNIRGNEPSIKFRYLQLRMDKEKTDKLYSLFVFVVFINQLYKWIHGSSGITFILSQ